MSRDQLTNQTAQNDAAPEANAVGPDTHGLRPDLYAEVMRMSPADANQLASMLQLYPGFARAILLVAASHLGNSAVQRAIQLEKSWHAQGRAGSLTHDELRASGGALDAMPTHDHAQGAGHDPAATAGATATAMAPQEPAWVAGARAYNATHMHLVSQFNDLTAYECLDDDSKALVPQAVAKWQAHHGIAADGKVGPQTVAAAKGPSHAQASELAAPAEAQIAEPDAMAKPAAAAGALRAAHSTPGAKAMYDKARVFNAAHPDLVREFNDLTDDKCLDDDTQQLDPHAVARWQLHHGEPADGMITADTIAAARATKASVT